MALDLICIDSYIMEARQQTHYNKNAVSVREIGYQEDKNYPSRQNMEDCIPTHIQKKSSLITSTETAQDYLQSSMDTEAAKSASTVPLSYPT